MTYDQLPQNPAPGVCLYCEECGESWSACRGDYFHSLASDVLCYDHADPVPLKLVQKRVRYVRVSPAKAEARP